MKNLSTYYMGLSLKNLSPLSGGDCLAQDQNFKFGPNTHQILDKTSQLLLSQVHRLLGPNDLNQRLVLVLVVRENDASARLLANLPDI